jgi:hypothetical protein
VIVKLISPDPAEKAADQSCNSVEIARISRPSVGKRPGETKRMMNKRMWLAGASLLAIVVGSETANAVVFGFTGLGTEYVTPSTGWYDFRVAGAQGGSPGGPGLGGAGAVVGGELFLGAGTDLTILVGGQGGGGGAYVDGAAGGGGGLSSIFFFEGKSFGYSFIAGGGGGNDFSSAQYTPPGGGPGIGSLGAPGSNFGSGGAGGLGVVVDPNNIPDGFVPVPATAGFPNTSGPAARAGYGTKLVSFSGEGYRVIAAGPDGGYGGGGGGGYNGGGGGGGAPGGGPGQGGYSYVTPSARDPFGITGGNHAGNGYVSIDFVGSSVPEPSTWAMMLAGFSLLGGMLVRRGKKPTTA